MPPPLLIVYVCPAGVNPQSDMPFRPRRHLIGRRRLGFLWLGICCDMAIVAIPVRADVGGGDVSYGVEAISDKMPVTSVHLDEVLQKLVVLRRP